MISVFYIYILFRLDGSPCYVGKGKGNRWRRHKYNSRNLHLARLVKQAGGELPCVKIRERLTEVEAFELERIFIKAIGREAHGGPLVNLTDGGEGPSGLECSEETRRKIGAAHLGSKRHPEVGRKISAAKMGKPRPDLAGKPLSAETREKISNAQLGVPRKPHTAETRAKMSAMRRGIKTGSKNWTAEQSREWGIKISKATKGHKKSLETRARISAAKVRYWTDKRMRAAEAQSVLL